MRRTTVCDLCGAMLPRSRFANAVAAHAAWHDRLDASVRLAAAGFARRSDEAENEEALEESISHEKKKIEIDLIMATKGTKPSAGESPMN